MFGNQLNFFYGLYFSSTDCSRCWTHYVGPDMGSFSFISSIWSCR